MKIVINKCYGGFSVSQAVYDLLGFKWDGHGYPDNDDFGIVSDNYLEYRKHPDLISAIEKIGEKESSRSFAKLRIVNIPDDIEWSIDDYDGVESIHENHRSW